MSTPQERALEIKKTVLEFVEGAGHYDYPITEWSDDVWEQIEECINGIYFEAWKDLLDPAILVEEAVGGTGT